MNERQTRTTGGILDVLTGSGDYFTEAEFLAGMRHDPAFNHFYAEQRSTITAPVAWRVSPLPPDTSGMIQPMRNPVTHAWQFTVILPRLPASEAEGFVCAHELTHASLYLEGFPAVSPVVGTPSLEQSMLLGTMLGNCLQDALISARLKRYGFNQPAYILADLGNAQRAMDKIDNHTPRSLHEQLCLALSCASDRLEFQNASGQATLPHAWHPIERKWSSVARISTHLVKLAAQTGYQTPAEQRRFIKVVIQQFQLGAYIQLRESA